ncbi:MAG: prolyl oligopeptidase family serine peptidase [Gammaproteobacteria bacterium]|nr:prolyl oligopeptidase family serine peptidase [Gammaproteobacteria bacterium]
MKARPHLLLLLALATIAGCSGSGHSSAPMSSPSGTTAQRGALIDNPPTKVATYAPSDLLQLLSGSDVGKVFLQIAYTPKCTITVYHLTYDTSDPKGNITPASGALMVPSSTSDSSCTGGRPIVVYAHGTTTNKAFNLADLSVADSGEAVILAVVFAAEGYIVVAPNYLGYDNSTLSYHPYLIAAQQSKEMIDAVTAARAALPTADAPSSTDGGKLFVTGYSEGGYVAMATHSAMQASGMTVTASAPMSGPYALSAFGDAIFEGEVSASATENVALLAPAYQNVYGNIWSNPADIFASPYDTTVPTLLPNTAGLGTLRSEGKFPSVLFSSTPPAPNYAIYTPATTPANLASIFASGFGTDYLITNSYRAAYLEDALMHPDGGFPTLTDGLPPASPGNGLRVDLKTNDLRNWSPTAPTLLCGGNSDPTVFFFNTTLMQNYWTAHAPATAPVILDIDSAPGTNDPYATLKTEFSVAKGIIAAQGGEAEVLAAYHGTLVPPFCLSAVKSFFDAH